LIEVTIGELARHELTFAAGVLARAYRDTPITIAILGNDPVRRRRAASPTDSCGASLDGSRDRGA
jgi:hypothetical protein